VDVNGKPVDWDATVEIAIGIERFAPTIIQAAISGNQAALIIPSAVCDQVRNSTAWRLHMVVANSDGSTTTTPLAVGCFERDDGGQP